MNEKLLHKLLQNTISALSDRYGNDGCNDIFDDEPLLKNVSNGELKIIEKEFIRLFPEEAAEYNKMIFNTQILDVLEKLLEEKENK